MQFAVVLMMFATVALGFPKVPRDSCQIKVQPGECIDPCGDSQLCCFEFESKPCTAITTCCDE
ncbi:hypothetical protein EJ04DRAFT_564990 [Polyplosphaeria fusca]|uniref:Uncharacterized protein n=1 Tax=Polyplosphaeria fusca TaxID=682080 RepID=A0A9P4V1Z8_9PLEO|nr:hypothetical protein EJ04DRAFT_564990 [Polyplosphaeria fusca]